GTAFFTTPGVPADRLGALRRAFDATMKDPELLADAQRINVGVSPLSGEELQRLVAEGRELPPALPDKGRPAHTPPRPNWPRAPPTPCRGRIDRERGSVVAQHRPRLSAPAMGAPAALSRPGPSPCGASAHR